MSLWFVFQTSCRANEESLGSVSTITNILWQGKQSHRVPTRLRLHPAHIWIRAFCDGSKTADASSPISNPHRHWENCSWWGSRPVSHRRAVLFQGSISWSHRQRFEIGDMITDSPVSSDLNRQHRQLQYELVESLTGVVWNAVNLLFPNTQEDFQCLFLCSEGISFRAIQLGLQQSTRSSTSESKYLSFYQRGGGIGWFL